MENNVFYGLAPADKEYVINDLAAKVRQQFAIPTMQRCNLNGMTEKDLLAHLAMQLSNPTRVEKSKSEDSTVLLSSTLQIGFETLTKHEEAALRLIDDMRARMTSIEAELKKNKEISEKILSGIALLVWQQQSSLR